MPWRAPRAARRPATDGCGALRRQGRCLSSQPGRHVVVEMRVEHDAAARAAAGQPCVGKLQVIVDQRAVPVVAGRRARDPAYRRADASGCVPEASSAVLGVAGVERHDLRAELVERRRRNDRPGGEEHALEVRGERAARDRVRSAPPAKRELRFAARSAPRAREVDDRERDARRATCICGPCRARRARAVGTPAPRRRASASRRSPGRARRCAAGDRAPRPGRSAQARPCARRPRTRRRVRWVPHRAATRDTAACRVGISARPFGPPAAAGMHAMSAGEMPCSRTCPAAPGPARSSRTAAGPGARVTAGRAGDTRAWRAPAPACAARGRPERRDAAGGGRGRIVPPGRRPPRRRAGRHACHGDPVPGEALEVENVRREVAEIRRPVHGDVHVPSPHVVEPRLGELRKYLEHPGAGGAPAVRLVDARVADPPAEEQAVVRGTPVIIEHEVHVGDRVILAHQAAHAVLAQRLGRDHVGADRHDPPVRGGADPVEIAAAGEDGVTRAVTVPRWRRDAHPVAGLDRGHDGGFVDPGAAGFRARARARGCS